jgi:hypothetical protein
MRRALVSGAAAGAASTVIFTAVHHVMISDIWSTLVPMLIAGVLCGVTIAWTYVLLFDRPRLATWFGYNLLYVILMMALGAASMLVFEPVTTVVALLEVGGAPPRELLAQALPLTLGFVVGSAALISLLWGRSLRQFGAVLVTCVLLYGLLGMNISILGLVFFASETVYLVALFFGLVAVLDLVYAATFAVLERHRFAERVPAPGIAA